MLAKLVKPTRLSFGRLTRKPQERSFLEKRFGKFEKGAVLPESITPACPRARVADFPPGFLPEKFKNYLEHNQKIASCCRHPENHDIEALKSHPEEPAPDIYIFHCTCGRKHRIFCVGATDEHRPIWE